MDIKKEPTFKKLITISFVQISLVLFCEMLAIFFTQFLVASTLVNSSLPSDFFSLTEENKRVIYQQELETLTKEFQENPSKVIERYYSYVTKTSPWILFFERLLWMSAFLPPAYFVIHRLFHFPLTSFSAQPVKKDLILSFSLGVLTFLVLNSFFLFLEKIGHKVEMNTVNKTLLNGIKGNFLGYLWALYSIGIITGIIEEIFFRGYLLNQFIHIQNPIIGLIFTSFIFGLMHHSPNASPLIALSLCFVGLVFGFVYLKTKNIWVTSLCHITYNSLVLTLGFFLGDMS